MILHWPDPQRAAGAAAPLRRASSSSLQSCRGPVKRTEESSFSAQPFGPTFPKSASFDNRKLSHGN